MKDYTFTFKTNQTPKQIFEFLLNVKNWWSGIYVETITGNSKKLNDEFSFSAGGGMHFSRQKLVELTPNKKISWQVTESNLSFLENPTEWMNTKLVFEISESEKETHITFTHAGLAPQIECYNECSNAWTQYLLNLQQKLNP